MSIATMHFVRISLVLIWPVLCLGCTATSPRHAILRQIPAFESFGPAAVDLLDMLDEIPPQRTRVTSLYMLHDGRWVVRDRFLDSNGVLTIIDRLVRLDQDPQEVTLTKKFTSPGLKTQFEVFVGVVREYAAKRDELSLSSSNSRSLHIWMGHSANGEATLDSFNLPERIWKIPGSHIGVALDIPDSVLLEVYVRLFDSKYSFDMSEYDSSPFSHMQN